MHPPGDSTVYDDPPEDDPLFSRAGDANLSAEEIALDRQVQWSALAGGRFEPREVLGRGGFAVVYRAYDHKLKREVALKIPHFKLVMDRAGQKWLRREGLATASLKHSHIVTLFDFHISDDASYLVSELIEGRSLAEFIKQHPQGCDSRVAAQIVLHVAEALAHAHENGVLHRDVKPSNILLDYLTPTDELPFSPRLADFGLASAPSQETLTRTASNLIGSVHYLPPEVIQGQTANFNNQGDVYALSVVLYELLTGGQAFAGANFSHIMTRIVQGDLPSPRRLRPSVPKDLDAICRRGMAVSPAKRYASADMLAEELRNFLAGNPVQARQPSWLEGAHRFARRHALLVTAGSILLLAVMGVALLMLVNNRQLARLNDQLEDRNLSLVEALTTAEKSQYQNEQIIYSMDMASASDDFAKRDLRGLRVTLDRYRDGQPLAKHRDVEWNLLNRLTRRESRLLWQSPEALYVAAYSDDGETLAVAGADGKITLLDSQSGQVRRQWDSEQIEVNALVFDPNDEATLWTTGDDGTVCAWATESGQRLWRCQAFEEGLKAFNLIYLRDLDRLVVRSNENTLSALDASQGRVLEELSIPPGPHTALQWALDGRHFVTAWGYNELRLYEGQTFSLSRQLHIQHESSPGIFEPIIVSDIAVNAAGSTACLCAAHLPMFLIDLDRWQQIGFIETANNFSTVRFHLAPVVNPYGKRNTFIASSGSEVFHHFEISESGRHEQRDTWSGEATRVFNIESHPTQNQFVSLNRDGDVRSWELGEPKHLIHCPEAFEYTRYHALMDTRRMPHIPTETQPKSGFLLLRISHLGLECSDWADSKRMVLLDESAKDDSTLLDAGPAGLWVMDDDSTARRISWNVLLESLQQHSVTGELPALSWETIELPRPAHRLRKPEAPRLVCSGNGQWVAGHDRTVDCIWFYQPDQPARIHCIPAKEVVAIISDYDGRRWWWNNQGDICSWEMSPNSHPRVITRTFFFPIGFALSPDSSMLAIAGPSRAGVRVWDLVNDRQYGSDVPLTYHLREIAFSATGHTLIPTYSRKTF